MCFVVILTLVLFIISKNYILAEKFFEILKYNKFYNNIEIMDIDEFLEIDGHNY